MIQFLASSIPFFLLGTIVAACGPPDTAPMALLALGMMMGLVMRFRFRDLRLSVPIAILALAVGQIHGTPRAQSKLPPFDGAFVTLSGRLDSLRLTPIARTASREASFRRLWGMRDPIVEDGRVVHGTVTVSLRFDEQLEVGDRVVIFGWLSRYGSRWQVSARLKEQGPIRFWDPRGLGAHWRRASRRAMHQRYKGTTRRVLEALILGRNELQTTEKQLVRQAGVSHLFAVSGLHLVLVCTMVGFLLRLVRLPDTYRSLLTLVIATCYAVTTGLQPPMARALACLALFVAARQMLRPINGTWCILTVATLELLRAPSLASSISFQLSFAAVVGIIWLGPKPPEKQERSALESFLARKKKVGASLELRSATQLTSAAIATTAPLTLIHFGTFTPVSLITNLALLPLVGLTLAVGLVDSVVSLPSIILTGLTKTMFGAIKGASHIPSGHLALGPPPAWSVVIYLICLCLALARDDRPRRRAHFLAWFGVSILLLGAWLEPEVPRLVFLNRASQFGLKSDRTSSPMVFVALESWPTEIQRRLFHFDDDNVVNGFFNAEGLLLAKGKWRGLEFVHLGAMKTRALCELCRLRTWKPDVLILADAGADPSSTAIAVRQFEPRVVLCHRRHTDSFLVAQRSGCLTLDLTEFREWLK